MNSHSELAITLMFQQNLQKGLECFRNAADALDKHVTINKEDNDITSEILVDLRFRVSFI